ncbi:MAG: hypothetical protein Q8W51_09325 [Candidatus Palauibacterales bacterium]|nr:hypothetical protein [Candidatus Palauibacterales bacterium]MDP2529928.1 hypothetical protein [Candidatus Palauibacterales bacterium]MDP2583348.1 hypothetical protein [Candidatus Palauibacterales bacterium]
MTQDDNLGPLLDLEQAAELEERDRARPIPGGEPECPACGAPMVRRVERHPYPRGGSSPFRVRLVCTAEDCRRWTVYDW